MLPGDRLPADGTEGPSDPTTGSTSLKPAQEIPLTHVHVTRENTIPADLIITQPVSDAAPRLEASGGAAEFNKPQDPQRPCPRCGCSPSPRVPDHRLPPPSPRVPDHRLPPPSPRVPDHRLPPPSPRVPDHRLPPPSPRVPDHRLAPPSPRIPDHRLPPPSPRVPDHRLAPPSSALTRLQGSSLSVQSNSSSKRSKSRDSLASSHQPSAPPDTASCLHLVLACLWCQCSVLLLGLLEACSSCLHVLCSSCCRGCAHCCLALQEAPVEELSCHVHCHSVLFESCCEPTECLEFCLECCKICHHS